eukprot:GEMP01100664.1.p1 GENE.GEMP01100664.1~~GEMP01100664.1.p1  ORF type:complete len:147 (+),score=33.99 GEMP01100664.1:129-569(+)
MFDFFDHFACHVPDCTWNMPHHDAFFTPKAHHHATSFAAGDAPTEAGYNREQLEALTRYRQQHRRTIDGRLCAAAFVQDKMTFTNCADIASPGGVAGKPWCYVEPQLLNQSAGLANWGFCQDPPADYEEMRQEVDADDSMGCAVEQ